MKIALTHFIKMGSLSFVKEPGMFIIIGADFMLDENLNLWLIEVNSGPGLGFANNFGRDLKINMAKQLFNLIFHMLENRTKHIINFLNEKY